jgi:hypothetical protein
MEDDLNIFENGRQLQFFQMKDYHNYHFDAPADLIICYHMSAFRNAVP